MGMAGGGGREEGEDGEVGIWGEVDWRAGRVVYGIRAVDGGGWCHLEEYERCRGALMGVYIGTVECLGIGNLRRWTGR